MSVFLKAKMPTKFVIRIFYIELIICGFFACVLVARNLCLSETGSPISCQISRRGNTSGRGASGRRISDPKVKVQGTGEVMNIGERRQNAVVEQDFQQLFLVSKDRYRPAQLKASGVSATEDGKPWLQREKGGKDGMESRWSEESLDADRREIMQSHDQLPEEKSLYEFLDMFEVSDWLSDKRRQRVKTAEQAGSTTKNVDLQTDGHASKTTTTQDDNTENNSKVKTRHAPARENHVNSGLEVLKSVISKAEPVRVKATIMAKGIIPRAKILDSEYLSPKAATVSSLADIVTSKEGRVTETKAPPGIPETLVVSDFPLLSESVKSSNRSGTINKPLVQKKTNSNLKEKSASKILVLSQGNQQSKIPASSDETLGFFGKVLNALFRSYDTFETPEQWDFDETDFSVQRNPEDRSVEMTDSLAELKDVSKDAKIPKRDAKKIAEIVHSTQGNGALAPMRDLSDDAQNSPEILKNDTGSAKDTSSTVKRTSAGRSARAKDRDENTNVISTNKSVSSESESLAVSLMKEPHSFDQNSKANASGSPQNSKVSSNSVKVDSYNAVNDLVKEEHFSGEGKEIHEKAENMHAKAKDNPLRGRDNQLKTTGVLVKAKNVPVKARGIVLKANDIPVRAKNNMVRTMGVPTKANARYVKARYFSTNTKAIDLKEKDNSLNPADMPSPVRGITEEIRRKAKEVPVKINDVRVKAEDISAGVDDISVSANEIATEADSDPVNQEDLSTKAKDMPAKAVNTLAKDNAMSKQAQDMPTKKTNASVSTFNPGGKGPKNPTLGKEQVKSAMFTEMENIMSELDSLGSLWEQLKPGMKLENSDALRKVLHAVANAFGLENKDVSESLEKTELEETATGKLRYDGTAQRIIENQTLKEFRDASSRDVPGGTQKQIGLRSKRSADRMNHRKHVQATDRDDRARRNSGSKERKYKRLAEKFTKQRGQEEEEKKEVYVDKKRRETSHLRKRLGYEDYIFGNNPGYILTRHKRDAPSEQAALDKAEEDAISRELTNLLIEKVYNRVMKTMGQPKPEKEVAQASKKAKEMQGVKERMRRNSGRVVGDLRRSQRDSGTAGMSRFCRLMKERQFNATDVYGNENDLYRQAVNAGLCLDFEMSQAAEHDMDRREFLAVAENEAEKDDEGEDKEVVVGVATMDVEGKADRQAKEEAEREVNIGAEKIVQREVEEETQGQTHESKTEVKNEKVVQKEVKGEAQRQTEETKTEFKNEFERMFEREAKADVEGGTQRRAQEEAKREINNEIESVVQRMLVEEETRRQAQDGAKREDKNEADSESRKETKVGVNEESVKDEATRETRDGPMEYLDKTGDNIAQFGTDAWELTKEKVAGVIGEKKRGVNEKANRKEKEELKEKSRSRVKTDRKLGDIMNYLNLKRSEADEKDFERQ